MADRLMHDKAIADYFGRSPSYGRRFLAKWAGRFVVEHGRRYIYESDFRQWLQAQEVAPVQQPVVSLKSKLKAIADRALERRKKMA